MQYIYIYNLDAACYNSTANPYIKLLHSNLDLYLRKNLKSKHRSFPPNVPPSLHQNHLSLPKSPWLKTTTFSLYENIWTNKNLYLPTTGVEEIACTSFGVQMFCMTRWWFQLNPFEKICNRQIGNHFPRDLWVKINHIWNHHLGKLGCKWLSPLQGALDQTEEGDPIQVGCKKIPPACTVTEITCGDLRRKEKTF